MSEGARKASSPEVQSTGIPPKDTNFHASQQAQASQIPQGNMEFASLPSQHFGQPMAPIAPFDMRHLNSALPDYSQTYNHGQQMPQFSQGSAINSNFAYASVPNEQFASQLANQFAQHYSQNASVAQRQYSGYSTNMSSSNTDLQARNHYYNSQQPSAYTGVPTQHQYSGYQAQQQGHYGQMSGSSYQHRIGPPYLMPRVRVDNMHSASGLDSTSPHLIRRNSSNSSLQTSSSTLRGPPRKPKQSGHALWVGNLPPGTQITDLKDHFARDATEDIESVFLISKSNCAFVNYRTEASCAAAMSRFHDSRFRGARLVCRLRRNSNASTSPVVTSGRDESQTVEQLMQRPHEDATTSTEAQDVGEPGPSAINTPSLNKIAKEKFFVVKSLTVEDLERSVSSGIWATQAHNETSLNLAFQTAENVYLIFSANKSGEYFGYARMESQVGADVVPSAPETAQQPPHASSIAVDTPLTIPTPATSTAPKGHIIDDSARGTIFWEAENLKLAPESAADAAESGDTSGEDSTYKSSVTQQTTFGKPFKITWQSTERLPFYRTRGLRNPWNANREVKIARDGTELEPSTGRKLIGMFEQQAQINAAARSTGPPPHYQYGYPQQLQQYPQMQPQPGYSYNSQGPNPAYGRPY